MASNIGAIQSYTFKPEARSDKLTQDVHGTISLQVDASEWMHQNGVQEWIRGLVVHQL